MAGDTQNLQALSTYLDGKIKRYNLMFAVNGGIFALARIITSAPSENPLGKIRLTHLAIGAIAFTSIMWFDVWIWGENMRLTYFDGKQVFQTRGKVIVSLLAALLIGGWLLATSSWQTTILVLASLSLVGAALAYHFWKNHPSIKNRNDRGSIEPHA